MGLISRVLFRAALLPLRGLRGIGHIVARHLLALFVLVGIAAYVLGVIGMRAYLLDQQRQHTGAMFTWPNALYFAGTLFVADTTPFQGFTTYPVTLELARFLAPLATTLGLAKAAGAVFAAQMTARRARRARDHVVVCGPGSAAAAVAAGARQEGSRVILIAGGQGEFAVNRSTGVIEIPGDPSDPATLRSAGVGRATRMVVCSEEGVEELSIVTVARDLARAERGQRSSLRGRLPYASWRDRPLECFTQAGSVDVVVPLQARAAVRPPDPAFALTFFSIDAVGARILAGRDVPTFDAGAPREVVVVGTSGFGRALVIELARARRSWLGLGAGPLSVAIAGPAAPDAVAALPATYGVVRSYLRLRPIGDDVATLMATGASHIYVCDDDPDAALVLALDLTRAAEHRPAGAARPIVTLRVGRVDRRHGDVRTLAGVAGVLDDADGGLRFFPMYDEACRPAEIYGETFIRMARAIHDDYVQDRLAENHAMRSLPALRPWDELSETFRQSNIAQARGFSAGLAALGYVIVPTDEDPVPVVFSPAELDTLARAEHDRWMAEMARQGYRFGPDRVDDGPDRRHPNMLPWDALTEPIRERDRGPMRRMPAVLALVDLEIVNRAPT